LQIHWLIADCDRRAVAVANQQFCKSIWNRQIGNLRCGNLQSEI